MKYYSYLLSCLLISLLYADIQTAEDILLKTFHRMDGINHSFKVESKSSEKKKKEKHFEIYVHWPSEGKILRKTRVKSILSDRKKPSSFWEHRFRNESKAKQWMSMPITGKLIDVSDKNIGKKEFSFSELDIMDEDIKSHDNKLLTQDRIDTLSAYVVESIKKSKNGKVKESKKLWIDVNSYMILKVEFYTGSSRLVRSIECSNFYFVEGILFPMNINVQDFKSKTNIQITIKNIEFNPEFDRDIFIPRNQ